MKENASISAHFRNLVVDLIQTATGAPLSPARKNLSLKEIADEFSPEIDSKIASLERAGKKFAAGQFKIIAMKERAFAVNYELYFETAGGKYEMVSKYEPPRNARIWLSNDAWLELRAAHEKVFDVVAPTE